MPEKTNNNLLDSFLRGNEVLFAISGLFAALFGIILDIYTNPGLQDTLLLTCAFFIFTLLIIFIGVIIFNGLKIIFEKEIENKLTTPTTSEIIQKTIISLILALMGIIVIILGQYFYTHYTTQFSDIIEIPIFFFILFGLLPIIGLYSERIHTLKWALFYSLIALLVAIITFITIANFLNTILISDIIHIGSEIPVLTAFFAVALTDFFSLIWKAYKIWKKPKDA